MAAAHSQRANLAEYTGVRKSAGRTAGRNPLRKNFQTPPLWRCFCVLGTWETQKKMCHYGARELGGVEFQSGTANVAYRNIILLGYDTRVPYVPNVPKGANAHSARFARGCEIRARLRENAGI